MPRVLLVLPTATYRAPDFLAAADALGAEVVVASEQAQTLAAYMGDRALQVDLCDPDAAAEAIASRAPLDAVVAVDDEGVLAAALAAERLGLPHNPPDAVAATRDKVAMRERLGAAGVPQPRWRRYGEHDGLAFPVVVKPSGLSASRGVIRADDPAALEAAARRVRAIAGDDAELIVESFVPGAEVAVEAIARDGGLDVLAIFDKPDPLDGPYFEETIYVTPSRHPDDVQREIRERVTDAARAIGLRTGPVHAEARLSPEGVVVLELAARSIGGLCSRSLRFGLGVSLEELILRAALGMDLGDLRRTDAATGVMMIPIPGAGTLQGVDGLDEARAVPGVRGVEITVPRGSDVVPRPEGDRYLGFIFASGAGPDAVEASLREAHRRLDIRIA